MHRKVKKEHIPSWLALNGTKDQTENLRDGVLVVASCLSGMKTINREMIFFG